jgi:hypothetical protein
MRRRAFGPFISAVAVAAVTVGAFLGPSPAFAHEEREAVAPDGSGSVPVYRTEGQTLLVCKTDAADFATRIAAFPADLKAPTRRCGPSARPTASATCRRPSTRSSSPG